MTTQLILANADKLGQINLAEITRVIPPYYGRNSHPSFFLDRELVGSINYIKHNNLYRHVKVYKGHFLDYIARKEYATLEDWVADCGSSMDHVRFGFQKFDGLQTHISLQQLVDELDPMPPLIPFDENVDEITKFMNKLHVDELSLKNLMVRTKTVGLLTYTEYMETD